MGRGHLRIVLKPERQGGHQALGAGLLAGQPHVFEGRKKFLRFVDFFASPMVPGAHPRVGHAAA